MTIPTEQFALFLMLLLRGTSMFVAAPMFGNLSIPGPVKIGLGVFLAFVLFPIVSVGAPLTDRSLGELFLIALREVLTGLSIGLAMQVLFSGIRFAGDMISFDMGFSMSTIFDAENGTQFPVISELLYWFLLMIFLSVNGHHFMLEAVYMSYGAVPIGTFSIGDAAMESVISLTATMFVIAVKIAAPLLVSLFLANISLGILNKVMPQMNIFAVMFPLKIGIGFIVLSATVPVIAFVFKKSLTAFEASVVELIKVM
ncbi:MAG: flagellar type III secretion system protein FliR [Bacteroidetes bacterium]|nr:flagellar type III secretion system protein FliR [Bacteroidota bacterium]